jgi:hypothetical protein
MPAFVAGCTNVTVVRYAAPEYADAQTEAGLETCETTGGTRVECCEAHAVDPCLGPRPAASGFMWWWLLAHGR